MTTINLDTLIDASETRPAPTPAPAPAPAPEILIPSHGEADRIADGFVTRALAEGHWPTSVTLESGRTESGLVFPARAVVGEYQTGERIAHGAVGARYHALSPADWQATVRAAVHAGARPVASRLMGGGVFAGFELRSPDGEFRNFFSLLDTLDGSRSLSYFATLFRVFCRNQQAQIRPHEARIRHTSTIEARVAALRASIEDAVTGLDRVRAQYRAAEQTALSTTEVGAIVERLFPTREKTGAARTRAENSQMEVCRALGKPCNRAGETLATVWNALTHVIDWAPDGSARVVRSAQDGRARSVAEVHIVGSRGRQVETVHSLVTEILDSGVEAALAR